MTEQEKLPSSGLALRNVVLEAGHRRLLDGCSIDIAAREITVIVGPSGAGKSVLLRTLAGLNSSGGSGIRIEGEISVDESKGSSFGTRLQRRVGIVFQQFALFDEWSAMANVQFAIDHRAGDRSRSTPTPRQWLDELGVPVHTRVSSLSGGQKQRLAIARTLAANPTIILYDEPTSGLDAATGRNVANLIRRTHESHHRTSIVVTHDYATLLPIADDVLLFDTNVQQLVRVPKADWSAIPEQLERVRMSLEPTAVVPSVSSIQQIASHVDRLIVATGSFIMAALTLPIQALPVFPRPRWGMKFIWHFFGLVGGPSAWFYLILAGWIVGFTATYFTFRFLPFRVYTQPLLVDELLASIGFALYRILVPVLATILIAARCGAAVAADVGVKKYAGQVDAIKTLGVRPPVYLLAPIMIAFIFATPLLEWVSFTAARSISLLTFSSTHPTMGPFFWHQHFYRNLHGESWSYSGSGWVLAKNLICGIGTASISYYQGIREKHSAVDVSHAITRTVLWTTLYVLVVHFLVALLEF
jgi:ABC-type transporter Mla maintaining outer membrane lipid asymmetry ATPase subunit MlaF/ABC-type transporter Mla maintaining outer membrane lipid asymmetry permease subunit MlaE